MAYRAALFLVIVFLAPVVPNVAGEPWQACGDTGNYEPKSSYLASINSIAATLPGNASASPDLFATAEVGAIPEQVSALGLCRGDANATSCSSCLTQAFRTLPDACAGNKDAAIFYDSCMLHYSNIPFVHDDGTWPIGLVGYLMEYFNFSVKSEPERFNLVVAALLNATAEYAANNSTRRYAAGEADFNQEYPKVYSMAQCTPDLTPARCRSCLAYIIEASLSMYANLIGARTLAIRCTFRYETKPFISGPLMVSLGGTPAGSGAPAQAPAAVVTRTTAAGRGPKYRVAVMVPMVLLPILAAIILVACLCLWRRRRSVRKGKQTYESYPTTGEKAMASVDSMLMDISALRSATGDFAESNKLGEGGFGAVYKGTLPDGSDIAVKRLSKSSTQGVEHLKNELGLVAKLKHKNLVSLVGLCLEQQESGYMAPEYVTRGNYSVKSDVFSFGVMVLEIITGRKKSKHNSNPRQSEDLLTMVWEHWKAGRVLETIDPSMNGIFSEDDARRCAQIALLCVQDNPVDRPVMSSVVMMLGSNTVSLQVPSKPEFFVRNGGARPGIGSDV
nr:unnamed protein product [Digitaria exilis]